MMKNRNESQNAGLHCPLEETMPTSEYPHLENTGTIIRYRVVEDKRRWDLRCQAKGKQSERNREKCTTDR